MDKVSSERDIHSKLKSMPLSNIKQLMNEFDMGHSTRNDESDKDEIIEAILTSIGKDVDKRRLIRLLK